MDCPASAWIRCRDAYVAMKDHDVPGDPTGDQEDEVHQATDLLLAAMDRLEDYLKRTGKWNQQNGEPSEDFNR